MKKLLVLAMMATLLMAGSAFALNRQFAAKPNATFSFGAPGIAAGPTTTNNDDSCDIGTAPAATLLLPYFEVDVNPTVQGQTTLFTITNVSRFPQIAHVTVWTDWSFPVLDFNIFLTGYDVQPINLYDVIVRGIVAPPSGTTPAQTGWSRSAWTSPRRDGVRCSPRVTIRCWRPWRYTRTRHPGWTTSTGRCERSKTWRHSRGYVGWVRPGWTSSAPGRRCARRHGSAQGKRCRSGLGPPERCRIRKAGKG